MMDRHRPLIAALFAGMYSRATTENDGLALARKTAYAFELAFFGKRPTEIPQLTVGRIQINFHHVIGSLQTIAILVLAAGPAGTSRNSRL